MTILKRGDSGAEVERLQEELDVEATGSFDKKTEAALKARQKQEGLPADGIAGPDTLVALGLDDLVSLAVGDTGEIVKQLQEALEIKVDGVFSKATGTAVAAYQKANGLPATGIADNATLVQIEVLDASGDAPPDKVSAAPAMKGNAAPMATAKASPPAPTAAGTGISTWAVQLADIDPEAIAALTVDVAVVDYARDGDEDTAFTPAEVARMKQRPDGTMKKLVCYMSIGEAEDYRYYWQPAWSEAATRPAWLDEVNPAWEGNFKVRYWDTEWQKVILGGKASYLDKILGAGFDGVYLDIVDAFEYWQDSKPERPTADADMIAFVTRIANYARRTRPDFLVIPQNGEALLKDASYRKVISAQAKEDVFYGIDGDGRANKKAAVNECLSCLAHATGDGIPVLVVEYLADGGKVADARSRLAEAGCTAYFAPRQLNEMPKGQFDV